MSNITYIKEKIKKEKIKNNKIVNMPQLPKLGSKLKKLSLKNLAGKSFLPWNAI